MKSLREEICHWQMKSKFHLDEIKSTHPTDKVDLIPRKWNFIVKRFIPPDRVDLVEKTWNKSKFFLVGR